METSMAVDVTLYTLAGGTLSALHYSHHNPKKGYPELPEEESGWAQRPILKQRRKEKVLSIPTIETRYLLRLAIIPNALGFAITD